MSTNITVITASYNAQRFLRETIESVANQTCKPFEHLIIDDKSTDDSLKLAKSLAAEFPNVRVIEHEDNKGFPAALNTGIAASKTDYIAILDSDDIALPNWLEEVSKFLADHPDVGVVGGGCIIMTEKGEITGHIKYVDKQGDVTDDILDGKYMILHAGSVINKNILMIFGGYAEDLKSLEDNDMFINMSSVSKVYNLGKPLIYYRRLRKSESRKTPEFSDLVQYYIKFKIKKIKESPNHLYKNDDLNLIKLKIKSVKRLLPIQQGQYEYEIFYYSYEARNFMLSTRYLLKVLLSKYFYKKIMEKMKNLII